MSGTRPSGTATPPGGFPQAGAPGVAAGVPSTNASSKAKKKKKAKAKKAAAQQELAHAEQYGDEDEDDDLPPLEDVDESSPPPPLTGQAPYPYPHPSATPSDLLSTASDLYRQIEAAAASALSTHPSFAASFPPPPNSANGGQTTDEAYWTSLPQHLRQFIRSALPLAAGLTTGPNGQPLPMPNGPTTLSSVVAGVNGQPLPPLTHDQLSSAAAQLAQVVQSNWGQLGLGPAPPSLTTGAGGARQAGQNGATISLGSFPVTMPTREQMEAAIGSIGGLGGEFGVSMQQQQQQAAAHQQQQQDEQDRALDDTEDEGDAKDGTETTSKSKKKKQKRKAAAQAAAAAAAAAAQAQVQADADLAARKAAAARAPAPNPVSKTAPQSKAAPPLTSRLPPQTTAAGKQPVPQPAYDVKSPPAPPGAYPHHPPASQHHGLPTPSIAPKAGPSSERERIRDFWLGLKEQERRALVKVEKEAVLRKMKEQQRSGCSCAVCGRKRCVSSRLEVRSSRS